MKWKLVGIAALGVVLVGGAGVALAAPRRDGRAGRDGVEAQERRFYVSLLRPDQQAQAKALLANFLAETAPDRDLAAARLLVWRSDATSLLSIEQRKNAGEIGSYLKHLDPTARWEGLAGCCVPEVSHLGVVESHGLRLPFCQAILRAVVQPRCETCGTGFGLLDGTDREALARRVERLDGASPEDRITIELEILDQAYDVFEPALAKRVSCTDDQRAKLRALYAKAKDDLRPIATRLERAKVELRRSALALLDAEQSAKFSAFHAHLRAKVLAFIRKTGAVTTPK
jgi:hypothetical protein